MPDGWTPPFDLGPPGAAPDAAPLTEDERAALMRGDVSLTPCYGCGRLRGSSPAYFVCRYCRRVVCTECYRRNGHQMASVCRIPAASPEGQSREAEAEMRKRREGS